MNSGLHDAVLVGRALADAARGRRARSTQLDEVLRRRAARSRCPTSSTVTHDNWEKLRETDPEAPSAPPRRAARAGRRPGSAMREHLLRTSMIDSLRERHGVDMVGVQGP